MVFLVDEKDKDDLPMGGIAGYSTFTGAPIVPSGNKVMSDLNWLLPGLKEDVPCPHCKAQSGTQDFRNSDGEWETSEYLVKVHSPMSVSETIIHLNDQCSWTREQVADWLDTLDVDLTFPTEPPPKPKPRISSNNCGCGDCTAQMQYPGSGPTITYVNGDPLPSGDVELSCHGGYAKQAVSYPPLKNDWPSVTWTLFTKLDDGDGDWETLGELTAVSPPSLFFHGAEKGGKQTLESGIFKDAKFSVAIDPAKVKEIFEGFTLVATGIHNGLKKFTTVAIDSFSKLQAYQYDEFLDYYGKQATWLTAGGKPQTPAIEAPPPYVPEPKNAIHTASTLPDTKSLLTSFTIAPGTLTSTVFPDGLPVPIAPNLVAPKSYPCSKKEKFKHDVHHYTPKHKH